MNPSDEVRAAAERIRKMKSGFSFRETYGTQPTLEGDNEGVYKRDVDNQTLADYALALLAAGDVADDGEPADSEWADSRGFRWSNDCTAMVFNDCGWEILLSGDLTECEKSRSLTLNSPVVYSGGFKCSSARVLLDNPTRGDVLRLAESLGMALPPAPAEGGKQ